MSLPPPPEELTAPDPLRNSSEVGVETIQELSPVEDVRMNNHDVLTLDRTFVMSKRGSWQIDGAVRPRQD
jgi:hypothetical protein